MYKILDFVRREKIYFILLLLIVLISVSLSFLDRMFEAGGLGGLFADEKGAEEDIIPAEKIQEAVSSNPFLYVVFLTGVVLFIFFCVIGFVLDAAYIIFNNRGESPIAVTQTPEAPKWNLWDICKIAIIFLFAQRLMLFVDLFILSTLPYLNGRENLRLMLSSTIVDIVSIAAVIYFVLVEGKQKIGTLGLSRKSFFVNIRYGTLAYIGLVPVLALAMFSTEYLFKMFNMPIEPQPVLMMLKNENHIPSLVYMGFFASILGPVMEEIFFRGFAYGVFKKRLGIFWGIVLSALFFAYIHSNLASFFPIFCLGVLLAYIYEKTGSLISSMTVHIIHNSLSLLFLLFVKYIL